MRTTAAARRSVKGRALNRRAFLKAASGVALGAAALPGLLGSASAAPVPRRGGTFKIPVTATVNPWPPIGLIQNLMVNKALFNGLLRYSPVDWSPQPDLAERWEVSPDGLTWTFHLRDGVMWHDGQPFTADDVKFTMETYADPKVNSVLRGNFAPVARVDAVNPTTVRVLTKTPYSSFVEVLCYLAFMMPKHLLEGQEFTPTKFPQAFVRRPIGTGPFKFAEHVPGDHLTVVANDRYHEGRPYLDAVIYKTVRDLDATIVQVKAGELDIAFPTIAQLPAVQNAPTLTLIERGTIDLRYFNINPKDPRIGKWYRDRTVRQALAHAINSKGIIQQVAGGKADRSNGPMPPAFKSWYVPTAPVFEYDPEQAKKMLAEAGFKAGADGILAKDGQRFAFTFNTDQGQPEREQTSLIVQQNLKDVGIDAQLQTQEFNNFMLHQRVQVDYAAQCFYQVFAATPDLYSYWGTNGSFNVWGYANPDIDRLYQQGLETFDSGKRHTIYRELYRVMAEDQAVNFIYHPREIQAISKKVHGFAQTDYRDALLYLSRVWIEG